MTSEERMNGHEACFICRRTDAPENLGVWLVRDRRVVVHVECWLAWYEQRAPRGRASRRNAKPPRRRDSEEAS